MLTVFFVNITVQLSLLSWNPGITCRVVGNSEGIWDIFRSQVLVDVIGWPEADILLVCILGEEVAAGAWVYYCWFFLVPVMDRIKRGGGLHLLLESKADEGELLNSLTLSTILDVPCHNNRLFHPLGRLAAFFLISNHESVACMTFILQWGNIVLGQGGVSSWIRLFW